VAEAALSHVGRSVRQLLLDSSAARVARPVDEVECAQHDGEVAGLVQAAPLQGALGAADPRRHPLLCLRAIRPILDGNLDCFATGHAQIGVGRRDDRGAFQARLRR
jgi:hypothetical protein